MTKEDKLILFRLIEGMQNTSHTYKINKVTLETSIEFLQLELIKEFNQRKVYHETLNTIKFVIKCKQCPMETY